MADKKRKKAKQQRVQAEAAKEQFSSKRADGAPEVDETASQVSKTKSSSKETPKGKDKSKDKGKSKDVVKSQARAKDPKKANKKPNIFRRFIEYIKQVRLEIKRTTWPTKNEVLNLTIIVLIALIFFGVIIFVLDFVMVQLLNIYSGFAPDAATADTSALVDGSAADTGSGDSSADAAADDSDSTGDDTATDGGE